MRYDDKEDIWNRPEEIPAWERANTPDLGRRKNHRRVRFPVVIVVLMCCLVLGAVVKFSSRILITTDSGELLPLWSVIFHTGSDGGSTSASGDASIRAEEADLAVEAYSGDSSGLTVTLTDAAGKPSLTDQQLYQQCVDATVSITVYAGSSGGYGSGMILTKDGYILTCAHLVEGNDTALVATQDGEEYNAQLVGSDAQTDLAVLKIDAENLTAVEFGQSDALSVGDDVLAIGDPLGPQFKGSLTTGIISGINRNVSINGYSMNLLQTTAVLNNGNSGGPLFNRYGQVIGVNNAKMTASSSAAVEGMGLAVPSATVKTIVESLAQQGEVTRAVLGISGTSVSKANAEHFGMVPGLYIASINDASQCAAAGLQESDIITAVDGSTLTSVPEFQTLTQGKNPGDTVVLTIYRDNDDDPDDEIYDYTYYGEITVALVDSNELE